MSRKLLALSLAVLPSMFLTPTLASAKGEPIEQRPSKVLLRATKMGYARAARLKAESSATLGQLHFNVLYEDRSGVPFASQAMSAYATFSDRASAIAGQKRQDPHSAERDVRWAEQKLVEIDQLLAKLPEAATQGFRMGALYQNPLLVAHEPSRRGSQLHRRMEQIYDRVARDGATRIDAVRKGVHTIETRLIEGMDERYLSSRKAVAGKLASMEPAELQAHAVRLMHEIDNVAHAKDIRRENVEKGSAQSHAYQTSNASSASGSIGLLGIHGSRSASSSYGEASSSASYAKDQLILEAATYTVHVRTLDAGAKDANALTPVEARMLTGLVLDLHAVSQALEKKDPHAASPFTTWLQHSSLTFVTPERQDQRYLLPEWTGRSVKIQLGHAVRDAQGLEGLGVISEKMAHGLDTASKQPLHDMMDTGSSLL